MKARLMMMLAASLLLTFAACGGPEERKAKYRLRAQEYMQTGNFPKARVALRNVLKIDPKDAEAYFLYAEVEEKEKNWRNAFAHYQRVIELVPDHEQALLKLGKFYLRGRVDEKVREIADRLLALHPNHVSARALKTALTASAGHLEDAIVTAEALSTQYPDAVDPAILLFTLYGLRDQQERAEPLLKKALELHPRDLDLLHSLAMTYVRTGNTDLAEATFRRIIEQEPTVFDHYLKLALFFDQQRVYERAESVLRDALRYAPESEERHLALADYLAGRRGFQAAELVLHEAERLLPHAVNIQFTLGRLYEMNHRLDRARATYEALADRNRSKPAGTNATVKLAALDWIEGKREEAIRELQEALHDNPRSAEALMLHGRIALQKGDGRGAIQDFRTVLKDQPEQAEAYALLGQSHLITEEAALAKENFEKAVALSPNLYQAHLALAILDASTGRAKDARGRLEEVLKQTPSDVNTLGLLLNLQMADHDWSGSEQTIARMQQTGLNQFTSDIAQGNLHQARLQWEQAIMAFERAAQALPEAPEPLFALVRIETRSGKLAHAQARLEHVIAQHPEHGYAHGLLGEILILKGDQERAQQELQKATRLKPQWSTPWMNWATLRFSQNDPGEAARILERGIHSNPETEELRILLASHLGANGQIDRAIAEYEAILQKHPHSLMAANNLAALLVDYKANAHNLNRALALTRDFEQRAPNPFFLDTLGWVHLKMGHQDEAIRVIERAVDEAPQQPILNYHLGMAHFKAGHRKQARSHLEKAVRSKQSFPGIEEARSVLAQSAG
jgi:tetratricopeptide (TPR) repeat protein